MWLSSWKFFKFWEPIQHPWKALFGGGGGIGPFVAQRWSNIGEIFTSILADKNTAWIIFPKFEFLRKWDRSFEENFDPLLHPISHWRWPKSKQSVKKCSHQAIQRWSNIGEIFTSIIADKNTAWITFPKFEFLRKWDRSFEENFDPLLQPISHWRWPNQNSQWKNAAIRLSKYVKVKTLSSFQFKRKIRLLLAIFWHFWTKKQGVVRG